MTNEKKLLNPCSPCICTGAPCEQCTFGYRTREENHKSIKELLLAVEAGEKPYGWKCAETYKSYHPNWKDELADEKEEKPVTEEKSVTHPGRISFQIDIQQILGLMSKAQAKETIEFLWNKYFKEDKT